MNPVRDKVLIAKGAVILISALSLFLSCTTADYIYSLDAYPTGKHEAQGRMSILFGASRDLEITHDFRGEPSGLIPSDELSLIPLLGMSGEFGVNNHLDIGGGVSLGAFTFYSRLYTKISVTDTNSALGLAFVPMIEFGGTPDEFLGIELEDLYSNFGVKLLTPLSLRVHPAIMLQVTPIAGYEKIRYEFIGDDGYIVYNLSSDWLPMFGVNLGTRINILQNDFFPQVSLVTFDEGKNWFPSLGVAIGV